MKNLPLLIGTIIGTLILIIGIAIAFSDSNQKAEEPTSEQTLIEGASNTKGSPGMKVKIVEFSDFECFACKANEPFIVEVLEKYPDDIFFAYRHFPLTQIHDYAMIASQFSEVMAQEGKFWEAHNILFANQEIWSQLDSEDEVLTMFEGYLTELEIDKTDFLTRIQSTEIKSRVNTDLTLSQKLKLKATPTFFVNGHQTPAPELLQAVETILAETE